MKNFTRALPPADLPACNVSAAREAVNILLETIQFHLLTWLTLLSGQSFAILEECADTSLLAAAISLASAISSFLDRCGWPSSASLEVTINQHKIIPYRFYTSQKRLLSLALLTADCRRWYYGFKCFMKWDITISNRGARGLMSSHIFRRNVVTEK